MAELMRNCQPENRKRSGRQDSPCRLVFCPNVGSPDLHLFQNSPFCGKCKSDNDHGSVLFLFFREHSLRVELRACTRKPLALGSYWGLLAIAVMMPFLLWWLFDEERFLGRNLLGYREYCERVPRRLIPGVFEFRARIWRMRVH